MVPKSFRISLVFVVVLLSFVGCGKKSDVAMRAGHGGKKLGGTYTLNEIRGNPASMDPVRIVSKLEDDIAGNIYDKLVDNDQNLQLQPELASRYDISADGKTCTFHLRTDAPPPAIGSFRILSKVRTLISIAIAGECIVMSKVSLAFKLWMIARSLCI